MIRRIAIGVASATLCLSGLIATQAEAATKTVKASGGPVIFSTSVRNAQTCTWKSSPKIAGFGRTVKCKNGVVADTAKFKANTSTAAKSYEITLEVKGKSVVVHQWKVTQAGETPPTTSTSTTTTPVYGIGATQQVHDASKNPLTVTFTQLIDPATGIDQFNQPNSGYRFVAVVINLANPSTAMITSDSYLDVQLVGTDNQAYSTDFSSVTECTNFSSGSFTLLPGGTENGCVLFQVPLGVNVKLVQFSLGYGYLDVAQWNL